MWPFVGSSSCIHLHIDIIHCGTCASSLFPFERNFNFGIFSPLASSIWGIFLGKGHTRQGLRCRICKTNVHVDCAAQMSKCQAKQKLLRRQKSTSEIVSRGVDSDESEYSVFPFSFLYPILYALHYIFCACDFIVMSHNVVC